MRQKWIVVLLTVACLFTLAGTPARADGIHVVKAGDNLRRIAARYGITVSAILQANGLANPDFVYVGQRLRIPASGMGTESAGSDVYVVQSGDTLFGIARRLGVSRRALIQANGLDDASFVWVGQRLLVPNTTATDPGTEAPFNAAANEPRIHVVASGETLYSIALQYGLSATSIAQANHVRSAHHIVTGQRLVIPGGAPSVAVAAPTQGRWIDIDVSRQRLVAYEGDRAVFSATVSTGKSSTPTVLGRFAVGSKYRTQRMYGPGYDLPNVPWVMYFHGSYAIHGTYWHNSFGVPVSHGCVNLRVADAQWLYNWADSGTPVVVHQ